MTDAIRPALTPEEWEAVHAERATTPDSWSERGPLQGIGIGYTNGRLYTGTLCNAYSPVVLVALINHALPDGHPNKFTREDVELVLEIASAVDTDNTHYDHDALHRGARSLAARIEALLPPE